MPVPLTRRSRTGIRVASKGGNDVVFLGHAKKMMWSSFGVLGWLIFTVSFPYVYALYEIEQLAGANNFMDGLGDVGQSVGDAGHSGAEAMAKVSFVYITFLALFMLLPGCCPCIIVPLCGYYATKHQDRGLFKCVVCQHGTGAIVSPHQARSPAAAPW